MKLYHSSLGHFSTLLARGPTNRSSNPAWSGCSSSATRRSTSHRPRRGGAYANAEWPEQYRYEFHYLLARYHFARGRALDEVEQKAEAAKSFEEAQRLAAKVPRSDPFYARNRSSSRAPSTTARGTQTASWRRLRKWCG